MADYLLYTHKNSYAMTTHLMLEELGVDYDTRWFNVHQAETFPPEFEELNDALTAYLAEITERVIKEEVHGETGDVDEVDENRQIGRAS